MTQDELKRAVGEAAAAYIRPKLDKDSVVGVGTGSTANCFIDALAQDKFFIRRRRGQAPKLPPSACAITALKCST